ncbi:hypothetical protein MuYL_1743 [Mucilaginibacter xinganensis]|uniref:Uncharacterized protein n=1 Tax=Mucilaginibacter xinganensis TaxID=1234841 RepID=A0A223NUR7_9SPHI|nr:hypothetical protein MuYL_1743 [Mucilaginibacter xinganensis]
MLDKFLGMLWALTGAISTKHRKRTKKNKYVLKFFIFIKSPTK